AVLWSDHATRTRSVTARAFDFTEIAERHGFRRIPPRSTFPQNYMSAEWWHFQCEAALVPWISQFGIELLSLAMYTERQLTANTDIWANRKRIFKRGRRRGWY